METQSLSQERIPMPTIKVGVGRHIVIPKTFYSALGLSPGDYLKVLRQGNRLVLTPKRKMLTDKSAEIDRRLADAEEDIRQGRVSGPFKTADELLQHLNSVSTRYTKNRK